MPGERMTPKPASVQGKRQQVTRGPTTPACETVELDVSSIAGRGAVMSDSLHQHDVRPRASDEHRAVNALFYTGGIFGYRFSGNRAHVDHVVPARPMISKMISDKNCAKI